MRAWLRAGALHLARVGVLVSTAACSGPLPRPARALYPAEVSAIMKNAPPVVVVDAKKYGLTVLPPRDATMDRRVRLTAPGLPFLEGRIEVTVFLKVSEEEIAAYQHTLTYEPVEATADLTLDLPAELSPGEYTIEARLLLYGNVEGVAAGQVERVRRQRFTRGSLVPPTEASTATAAVAPPPPEPKVFTREVDDYDLNQILMTPGQLGKFRAHFQDIARPGVVQVNITGQTCDLGGSTGNEFIARARAQAAAVELHKLGLPQQIEPLLFSEMSATKPDPTANTPTPKALAAQRRKLRKVVVTVVYR